MGVNLTWDSGQKEDLVGGGKMQGGSLREEAGEGEGEGEWQTSRLIVW